MTRLYVFAEGPTEQTFASNILKPYLANYGVYIDKPILIAHARKKGKVHRGGGRKFGAMQRDIERFLKQESGNDVFFTSMIDLYALHQDFPRREEAENLQSRPYDRVEFLETAWSEFANDSRFIPFIQLHEFEAYLFSDIEKLNFFYSDAAAKIRILKKVVDSVESPELIDNGPHTAPSKRIIDQFPEYEKSKTTIGLQAAEQIGLAGIRSKCPHFDTWVKRLENFADR